MSFIRTIYYSYCIESLQVRGVRISKGTLDGSPSLTVSWIAVSESGVTYTVWYSTSSGTTTEPPSGVSELSGIFSASATLTDLSQGTTYYIWVAAVRDKDQGPYSLRTSAITFQGTSVSRLSMLLN